MRFNNLELKAQRVRAGKSQADMARDLGMSTSSYASKERGDTKITVDEFSDILKVLNLHEVGIFFVSDVAI